MLLVILGAGASFDSRSPDRYRPPRKSDPALPVGQPESDRGLPVEPDPRLAWRPPLANDLFRASMAFEDIRRSYGEMFGIVDRLTSLLPGQTLEDELDAIWEEGGSPERRAQQFLAMRYYIRDLITRCQQEWLKIPVSTNYHALIDRLLGVGLGHQDVAFVTFNYDSLLENAVGHAFRAFAPATISDYVQGAYPRIFKLHGSINWRQPVSVPLETRRQPTVRTVDTRGRSSCAGEMTMARPPMLEGEPA